MHLCQLICGGNTMNETDKKRKKGRQIKYIISLISVGIFMYSYFVLYVNYTNKTTDAYKEIERVKLQIMERELMLQKEEEISLLLDELNAQKQKIIDSYPVYIAKEDNFMFVEKMENALDIKVSALSISDNTGFYSTILPEILTDTDSESLTDDEGNEDKNNEVKGNDVPSTMNGIVNTIGMNFLTTYEGFKELSDYIRDFPEPTVIDNVSVSYDSSTGALAGNLTLKRFALTGTGKEYKSAVIDGIDIGTDNIFGTDSN